MLNSASAPLTGAATWAVSESVLLSVAKKNSSVF
jgi:hypothetical protein